MPRGSLVPYLLLLCPEGLSALLQKSVEHGILKGVAACARGPKISHLFFVDDSLTFYQVTIDECSNLISIMHKYEQASGQQLNREKTSLIFNCNTPQAIQDNIKNQFGAEIIKKHEKYLGLSSLVE